MQINRFASIIVGIFCLGLAAVLWATPAPEKTTSKHTGLTKVTLDRVERSRSLGTARFSGVIRAKNRAVLSFAIPARLMERRVDPGSYVRKGQILALLDDREFGNSVQLARAKAAELEAQWKQAGRDHRRFETLAASDVISESDLDKITTRKAALGGCTGQPIRPKP